MSWLAIAGLALGAYGFKAIGLIAGPRLPIRSIEPWLALLPAAVLAALVVVETFDGGRRLVVDARAVGVVFGAIVAWRRAPFAVVIVVAAATTALVRVI